jgi:hypothetical protein
MLIQPDNQRVIRVFSVTPGDMLQRPATIRQIWSGLMSDPEYGDLYAKIYTNPKRAVVMCFVAQGNETPEAGPAGIVFIHCS